MSCRRETAQAATKEEVLSMTKTCRVVFSDDGKLFIEHDGKRIATRGPGAKQWTILEPGYSVRGAEAGNKSDFIEIEFQGAKVH
jgi:hypothetical protein